MEFYWIFPLVFGLITLVISAMNYQSWKTWQKIGQTDSKLSEEFKALGERGLAETFAELSSGAYGLARESRIFSVIYLVLGFIFAIPGAIGFLEWISKLS